MRGLTYRSRGPARRNRTIDQARSIVLKEYLLSPQFMMNGMQTPLTMSFINKNLAEMSSWILTARTSPHDSVGETFTSDEPFVEENDGREVEYGAADSV